MSGFDPPIVGSSPAVRRLRELILSLSGSEVSVLITGESGVGKEVLAQNLHRSSRRRRRPLVPVNCAALAPGTLESELFGHDRGAFTGAVRAHAGLFEQAAGGTLFLDEIGEMPPFIQAKLLRVLQEGEVRRMGEAGTRHVDVRVIAATNAPLSEMVAAGTFRKDLFYRINVVEAIIPPLRQRREDVLELLVHFFERHGRAAPPLSDDACRLLLRYPWPGNVRELDNELQRLLALYGDVSRIVPEMFSDRIQESEELLDDPVLHDAPLEQAMRRLEERLVRRALVQTRWNKSRTARRLGLSRQGLANKIERYGISRESCGGDGGR